MSVKIRLKRVGKRSQANYRIVVIDESSSRQGREIEIVGTHNPHAQEKLPSILKMDRIDYWLTKGAIPTDTIRHLIKKNKTQKNIRKS